MTSQVIESIYHELYPKVGTFIHEDLEHDRRRIHFLRSELANTSMTLEALLIDKGFDADLTVLEAVPIQDFENRDAAKRICVRYLEIEDERLFDSTGDLSKALSRVFKRLIEVGQDAAYIFEVYGIMMEGDSDEI